MNAKPDVRGRTQLPHDASTSQSSREQKMRETNKERGSPPASAERVNSGRSANVRGMNESHALK